MALNLAESGKNHPPMSQHTFIKEVGRFSCDADGEIHLDDRQKKYFRMPGKAKGLDTYKLKLREGYSANIVAEMEKERGIDYILDWAALVSQGGGHSTVKDIFGGADIVAHQKALLCAGDAPYDDRFQHDIVATKYKGVIFLCHFDTDREIERKQNAARDRVGVLAYAGRKFERLMTGRGPRGYPSCWDEPVSALENYYIASVYSLGSTTVFVGGAVDCFNPKNEERMESRTHAQFYGGSRQEDDFYEEKCRHVWLNLHLTKSHRVCFGLREDDHIVRRFLRLRTTEIHDKAKEEVDAVWEPAVCMTAVDRFIGFVKEQLGGAEDLVYKRFVFGPMRGQVEASDTEDPKYHFLTQKFLSATIDIP